MKEAGMACRAGAWAIGEVFAPSRRRIEVDQAAAINRALPGMVLKAGVFVNEQLDTINCIIRSCHLDIVQLHGEEPPEMLAEIKALTIKSFKVREPVDPDQVKRWRPWAYLFDTPPKGVQQGGSGRSFPWDYLQEVKDLPNLILAGGLNPSNVGAAIRQIRPLAVDVSSGVEFSEGGKDPHRIEQFMRAVREADEYVAR